MRTTITTIVRKTIVYRRGELNMGTVLPEWKLVRSTLIASNGNPLEDMYELVLEKPLHEFKSAQAEIQQEESSGPF